MDKFSFKRSCFIPVWKESCQNVAVYGWITKELMLSLCFAFNGKGQVCRFILYFLWTFSQNSYRSTFLYVYFKAKQVMVCLWKWKCSHTQNSKYGAWTHIRCAYMCGDKNQLIGETFQIWGAIVISLLWPHLYSDLFWDKHTKSQLNTLFSSIWPWPHLPSEISIFTKILFETVASTFPLRVYSVGWKLIYRPPVDEDVACWNLAPPGQP